MNKHLMSRYGIIKASLEHLECMIYEADGMSEKEQTELNAIIVDLEECAAAILKKYFIAE